MNIDNKSGGERARETPVPIPNTEVKPRNADDTVLETARESRWLPDFLFLFVNVKYLTIYIIKREFSFKRTGVIDVKRFKKN